MSTRLNSLLCFMLLVLSITVLGPAIIHHREQVIATCKSIGADLVVFSRHLYGEETETAEAAAPVSLSTRATRELSQAQHFFGGLAARIETAMVADAHEITHMVTAKAELIRTRTEDGIATDKKAFDRNLVMLAAAFPETATDARHMWEHSTDFAAMAAVFTAQTQAVATADPAGDEGVEAEAETGTAKPVKLAALHAPKSGKDAAAAQAPTPAGADTAFDVAKLLTAPSMVIKTRLLTIFRTAQSNG